MGVGAARCCVRPVYLAIAIAIAIAMAIAMAGEKRIFTAALCCRCLPAKPVVVFSARATTTTNKQLNGLRAHISELSGAVGAHISSLASPVYSTNATSIPTRWNLSEWIRTHPKTSENVRKRPKTFENVRKRSKTFENVRKHRKRRQKPEMFRNRPNASESIRTHPNVSKRIRTHPNRSEQVRTHPKINENDQKLIKNVEN